MRIAIITENFLPKLDGVTRTLVRLLDHLQSSGHHALLLGPESGMDNYAGAEVIGTAGLPLPFYPELKFNFFRPLFMRRLNEFLPDIIHLVDPVILGATGLAAGHLLHKPIVSSYHTNLAAYCEHFGFPLLKEPMWTYNRFIHNQCAMTFCPSPSTAAMLRLQGFEHLRIWPRGVDTTLYSPGCRRSEVREVWLKDRTQPESKTVLLYVGRVSWEKNLNLLIQVYQQMDHGNCHLVIVGDGPAFAEVQQKLSGLPVTFTGYLSGEPLASAYASADIFAFPSTTETFGQVVLEAMASGLPVAGVLSEGVCDLVNHGQTGFLLNDQHMSEEKKLEGYRSQIDRLVTDNQLRAVMSNIARLEAQKRSWLDAMECLIQGYCEVIEAAKTPVAA
jgi:glycosyltransferase involved in cell wall biosynthesis